MRKLIIAVLAALLISIGVFAAVQSVQPDRAEAHLVSCWVTPDLGDWPLYGNTYYLQARTDCSGAVPIVTTTVRIISAYGGTVGTYTKTCAVVRTCTLVAYPTLYPGTYSLQTTNSYYDDGMWWGPYYNYWTLYVYMNSYVAGPY